MLIAAKERQALPHFRLGIPIGTFEMDGGALFGLGVYRQVPKPWGPCVHHNIKMTHGL